MSKCLCPIKPDVKWLINASKGWPIFLNECVGLPKMTYLVEEGGLEWGTGVWCQILSRLGLFFEPKRFSFKEEKEKSVCESQKM